MPPVYLIEKSKDKIEVQLRVTEPPVAQELKIAHVVFLREF